MALAIEQTIGLASPSEVGEWVEMVAGDELQRRAQTIAEIEVASLGGPRSDPKIGLAKSPVSEPHSQVSSISVSRPAISVTPARRGSAKLMLSVFALLALVGGGLGVFAMRDVLSAARHQEPNRFEGDQKRRFELFGPFQTKAPKDQKEKDPPTVIRPPPPPTPPPVTTQKPPPKPNCDPPFTIDPASGRKKYKMECIKSADESSRLRISSVAPDNARFFYSPVSMA